MARFLSPRRPAPSDTSTDAAAADADAFWGTSSDWSDAPTQRMRRVVRHDDLPPPTSIQSFGEFDDPIDFDDHPTDVDEPVDLDGPVDGPSFDRPTTVSDRGHATRIDPLLARLGAGLVVATLLVPLGLAAKDDAGGVDRLVTADALVVPLAPKNSTLTDTPSTITVVAPATTGSPSSVADVEKPQEATDPSAGAPSSTVASVEATAPADDTRARMTIAIACASEYDVTAGDYWLRLADASGASIDDLLAVNDATMQTPLYPGDSICLPPGASTPAPPTTTAAPRPTAPPATTPPAPPTSTRPPATTPAPAPAPNVPVSAAEVERIVRSVWPDELEDRALQIVDRESNFVPTARNRCCYGLFQIYFEVHRSWLADLGVTSASQLFDPLTNARAAYTLYQRAGGFGPWT